MDCNSESRLVSLLINPLTRKEAFGELVEQYSRLLYWKIRRIVLIHEDADDALQNTFIKAWKSIDQFRGNAKISTWLYRIAINEALELLRKKKQVTFSGLENCSSLSAKLMADDYFDGDEIQALLQEAIDSLPDVQKMVFTFRYYENMKYSDMSKLLDTSEGALKASYHIAVKKITSFLQKQERG